MFAVLFAGKTFPYNIPVKYVNYIFPEADVVIP